MMKLIPASRMPRESLHPDSSLEWWFVHGAYQGSAIAKSHFMISLFRHGLPAGESDRRHGFSLICSLLDPASRTARTFTRVDRYCFEYFLTLKPKMLEMGLDARLLQIYFDELRANGPLRGIELSNADAAIETEPFSVNWKDFSLSQSADGMQLRFMEPGSSRKVDLELRPESERVEIKDWLDVGGDEQGLRYYSYPRLALVGRAGTNRVSGSAWFDHQWGRNSFLMGGGQGSYALGWDWLGVNLDDGSDWIIGVLRNMKTRRPLKKFITVRNGDNSIHRVTDFKIRATRHWESAATNIRYPVGWKIEVPELQAKLTFAAVAEDQEIPVLGLMRAIWEGAGAVTGSIAGRTVRGTARAELQGYGYLYDSGKVFGNISKRIDRHIESFLPKTIGQAAVHKYVGASNWKLEPSAYTEMLSKPVWDLMLRGGKKWRPMFAIMLLDALGGKTSRYEVLISALAELTHTGSLIIDDIEDSSLLRRGDQCIHLRYGQDVAINAANTIYFLPMLTLMNHQHLSEAQRLAIHEVVMRQFVRAHFGQALDLFWTGKMSKPALSQWLQDSPAHKILQMYEFKSAAIVEGLAETAAIIAGAGRETREVCSLFARSFGVSFQIIDDVHNFSRAPRWRKTCGEDLREGKLTYVLLRAIGKLNGPAKKRLQTIVVSEKLRSENGTIEEGVALVQQSGALEQCREEAKDLVAPLIGRLSEKLEASESKIFLLYLCRHLLDLDLNESRGS